MTEPMNGTERDSDKHVPVILAQGDYTAAAQALARRLGLPVYTELPAAGHPLYLSYSDQGVLSIGDQREAAGRVHADFTDPTFLYRLRRLRHEALLRAIGVKADRHPSVIDGTAGLGQDGFLLAAAGCCVDMIERSAVVHALLENALSRIAEHEEAVLRAGVSRVTLHHGESRQLLCTLPPAEVIYLDPMFPERRKTAKVKKNMYLLQKLLHDDAGASEGLLAIAMQYAEKRVVVKRPRIAPVLDGIKPTWQLKGRSSRFDIYTVG